MGKQTVTVEIGIVFFSTFNSIILSYCSPLQENPNNILIFKTLCWWNDIHTSLLHQLKDKEIII